MDKILIVEDDIMMCGGVKIFLEEKGCQVSTAFSYKEAVAQLGRAYDLVLLDHNLPDGTGMELCKRLRLRSNVPIIFMTAMDTNEDMIAGFQAGCDDYISKPFSLELLYERMQAVLRRSKGSGTKELFQYLDMTVDFDRMQVMIKESVVRLSATEYKLLELLIRNQGQVLTRDAILANIWDCDENYVDENTLNVHIRRLRQKLEEDSKNPKYIITVFGIGYTFGE